METLFLAFICGWLFGFLYFSFRLKHMIKHIVKNANLDKEIIIEITKYPVYYTEIHNDVILMYDVKTKDFIAQGKNLDEIGNNLKLRKINVAQCIHENTVYIIKDGLISKKQ